MTYRIAILGDFNPIFSTHHALNDSVRQTARQFTDDIQFDWISTDTFSQHMFEKIYSGLWIAPGSPYKNAENVIHTITYARENEIPTLGNCGGFQHMVIEYARNVAEIKNANHEETNPDSDSLVISKLSCSLKGLEEELTITDSNSLLHKILRKNKMLGKYYCSYGINPKFANQLFVNGLHPTAYSVDHQIRAFELIDHPFFVGTLFQPALTSSFQQPDPIIGEFVKNCLNRMLN